MQGNEKHGALWLTDTLREIVFEEYDEKMDIISVVIKKRNDHFIACLMEKVEDPNCRLPIWCDVRPEGVFTDKKEAIEHTKALLKARNELA